LSLQKKEKGTQAKRRRKGKIKGEKKHDNTPLARRGGIWGGWERSERELAQPERANKVIGNVRPNEKTREEKEKEHKKTELKRQRKGQAYRLAPRRKRDKDLASLPRKGDQDNNKGDRREKRGAEKKGEGEAGMAGGDAVFPRGKVRGKFTWEGRGLLKWGWRRERSAGKKKGGGSELEEPLIRLNKEVARGIPLSGGRGEGIPVMEKKKRN